MKKICLVITILMICLSFSACSNNNDSENTNNNNNAETDNIKIETRDELVEIMGGVLRVDNDTLWVYHYKLREPYYICGYVVPNNSHSMRGFVLGDSDYTLTTPTIDVADYHYSKSEYEEKSFVYIKTLPNGENGVFLREIYKTKTDNEYMSVEEYCAMSKKIHNTYFETSGFIGSVNKKDDYWICKMYSSEDEYKNEEIDWGITLLFDEYPSNINGRTIRVTGKYSPIEDEPWLTHCSIIDD